MHAIDKCLAGGGRLSGVGRNCILGGANENVSGPIAFPKKKKIIK